MTPAARPRGSSGVAAGQRGREHLLRSVPGREWAAGTQAGGGGRSPSWPAPWVSFQEPRSLFTITGQMATVTVNDICCPFNGK